MIAYEFWDLFDKVWYQPALLIGFGFLGEVLDDIARGNKTNFYDIVEGEVKVKGSLADRFFYDTRGD